MFNKTSTEHSAQTYDNHALFFLGWLRRQHDLLVSVHVSRHVNVLIATLSILYRSATVFA